MNNTPVTPISPHSPEPLLLRHNIRQHMNQSQSQRKRQINTSSSLIRERSPPVCCDWCCGAVHRETMRALLEKVMTVDFYPSENATHATQRDTLLETPPWQARLMSLPIFPSFSVSLCDIFHYKISQSTRSLFFHKGAPIMPPSEQSKLLQQHTVTVR